MNVVPLERSKLTLPEVAELAKAGTVILTRGGKPVVAVKDLSRSDWESVSLANNPKFLAIIEESRRSYRESGGIPLDDLRKGLGLKPKRRSRSRKKT
jgi:hypothetical protein